MTVISNILYWISTGLLVPVIVLLIFFFIKSLILVGAFFGQYMTMKKTTAALYSRLAGVNASNLDAFAAEAAQAGPSPVTQAIAAIVAAKGDAAKTELLLSEYEIAADKNVASSKVLTKLGPILGLMGTLIPMGPALVGLATGDIASMAYNMQVAFATTVVGLVVSAIGFVTQQARERWAVKDITILEYIADITEK